MASVERDYGVRENHWERALESRDTGWSSAVFGMGLGRFPATNYWRSSEGDRTAAYQLVGKLENRALRVGTGRPVYIDQIITVTPQSTYTLKLDVRAVGGSSSAVVFLCHKWLLSSYDCRTQSILLEGRDNKWQHVERTFDTGKLGADPWFAGRPVKLSLQNAGKVAVEFDNVQLLAPDGRNVVMNGNFASSMDHWNFTSDHHLAWHVKQLAVAVFYDQGIFGMLVMGALVLLAGGVAGRAAWRGSIVHGGILASLAAFMILGLFDTLIDAPRFLALLLLICWLALAIRPAGDLAIERGSRTEA
jgi:hypothetical protein